MATPMMNDLSHLSSNISVLQDCLSWNVLFYKMMNELVEKDVSGESTTGDEIIDQIDSPPVIMTSSNLMDIMMKPIFCYIDSDGDGNIDDEELSRSLETT
ncbi:MAG: hypothetical protein EZS28_054084, partial [Streblomastix strix]